MNIWIARHGQTNLNKERRMQGLTDEPLNETGIRQAEEMHRLIGEVPFDAVYASPLDRAIQTGSVLSGFSRDRIIVDERLIEVDFGKYEQKRFLFMGPAMTAYWTLPELFPAPPSVETTQSMKERSLSFLSELEQKDYDHVLIACHGGIMRALSGYLEDQKNGLVWRPKPRNCEIRVYESRNGIHRRIGHYQLEEKR